MYTIAIEAASLVFIGVLLYLTVRFLERKKRINGKDGSNE